MGKRVRRCMWTDKMRHLWDTTPTGMTICYRCGLRWDERLMSRPRTAESRYSGLDS